MTIKNLTPHALVLLVEDPAGEIAGSVGFGRGAREARFRTVAELTSEGVARATTSVEAVGTVEVNGQTVPVTKTIFGGTGDLPAPAEGVRLVVSLITASAAQFNTEKLNWLNAHYLKQADNNRLAELVKPRLEAREVIITAKPSLEAIISLYKERISNLNGLADAAEVFYIDLHPNPEVLAQHLTPEALPALEDFIAGLKDVAWEVPAIGALIKASIGKHGLKMPRLAMPLRVLLTGQAQTPSVDAVIALFPREQVLKRLAVARAAR